MKVGDWVIAPDRDGRLHPAVILEIKDVFGPVGGLITMYRVHLKIRGSMAGTRHVTRHEITLSKGKPPKGQTGESAEADDLGVSPSLWAERPHQEGEREQDQGDQEHRFAQVGAGQNGGDHAPLVPDLKETQTWD